jgi:hypothetical protein
MVKNHTFRFRVTEEQFEQINNRSKSKGYICIASYLRDLALNKNDLIESKILDTNEKVKKLLELVS